MLWVKTHVPIALRGGNMPKGKRAGGVNKMGAVREVIAKHGQDVTPVEIVKFAKEEHGAELSADVASKYKSAVLKELRRNGRKQGKKSKSGRKPAIMVGGASGAGGGISLDDISAVKKLVDQLGAEKVGQLAQVLAK